MDLEKASDTDVFGVGLSSLLGYNTRMSSLRFGTCSWKFEGWRGRVYSDAPKLDFLAEYARHFDCVEVDQWFWSLFKPDQVKLPDHALAAQYAASVPATFRFGVKMPNALTLTHCYPSAKEGAREPNPHFLSVDLLNRVLDCLEPMRDKLGPLMFQFGYLNRQMMPSQRAFLDALDPFVQRLPVGLDWCIEPRNPNWLNAGYFDFLRARGLGHVFQQGYYLPPVYTTYAQFADRLAARVVIRLHGAEREEMEQRSGKKWSGIVKPRDGELSALADMLHDLEIRPLKTWTFVNNHYEGCAPLTIDRIRTRLGSTPT